MKRGLRDRVDRLGQTLALRPIPATAIDQAFEHFRGTGVLPDNQRLAHEVARLTLNGRPKPFQGPGDLRAAIARLGFIAKELPDEAHDPSPPPPRNRLRGVLFDEAVHGSPAVREAARLALQLQVQAGVDVTADTFLADRPPPDFGCLGLHLLGFPECVAVPPYEAQAHRLFARQAAIRERIDHDDPNAFESIAAAIRRFRATAELPEDELLRECVLADTEFVALMQHMIGEGDAELLATLDDIVPTDGPEQTAPLRHLQELVRAGRLFHRELEVDSESDQDGWSL